MDAKDKEKQDELEEWIFSVKGLPGNVRIVKMKKHSKDLKKQIPQQEGFISDTWARNDSDSVTVNLH